MLPSSRHFSMVQLFVDMHTNTRAKINEKADEYQSAMDVFAELSKFADSKKDTITDSKVCISRKNNVSLFLTFKYISNIHAYRNI